MKQKQNKNTLYCFSPPVMIGTFAVEIVLALYAFLKLKSSRIKNIIVATLVLLASFQLAEFFVCSNYAVEGINIISRLGYVAITFLPVLSIHLANEIGGRKKHWSIYASYVLAIGFTAFFLLVPNSINDSICTGNYVIFRFSKPYNLLYGAYYFGLLLATLVISVNLSSVQKKKKLRSALHWLIIGVLTFTLPTGIIYLMAPSAGSAIPSVMCGFAVIYAIILAFRIAPLSSKTK